MDELIMKNLENGDVSVYFWKGEYINVDQLPIPQKTRASFFGWYYDKGLAHPIKEPYLISSSSFTAYYDFGEIYARWKYNDISINKFEASKKAFKYFQNYYYLYNFDEIIIYPVMDGIGYSQNGDLNNIDTTFNNIELLKTNNAYIDVSLDMFWGEEIKEAYPITFFMLKDSNLIEIFCLRAHITKDDVVIYVMDSVGSKDLFYGDIYYSDTDYLTFDMDDVINFLNVNGQVFLSS